MMAGESILNPTTGTPSRPRKRRTGLIVLIVVVGAVAGFVAYCAWGILFPYRYDSGIGATASDVASYTSVPPSPQAKEMQVASYDYGQYRLVFVRFTAPAEICRSYAQALAPGQTLGPLSWNQKYSDLMSINAGSHRFTDLRWFDLPYATQCWSVAGGKNVFTPPPGDLPNARTNVIGCEVDSKREGYLVTSVRVDVDRGVFYYLRVN
jgi:hypothetical protein